MPMPINIGPNRKKYVGIMQMFKCLSSCQKRSNLRQMPFLKLKEVGMRETCAWIAVGPLGHYCVLCPTMSQLVTFAPFVLQTFDQKSTSCRQGNLSTWILYFKTDRMSFDYYVSCPTMSQFVTYWSCSSPPHSLTKNYNLKTRYSADWDFYFKRDRMSFD